MYDLKKDFFEDKFILEYYKSLKEKNHEKAKDIIKVRISDEKLIKKENVTESDIENYIKKNWSALLAYQTILNVFYLFHKDIDPIKVQEFLTDGFNDCSFDAIYCDDNIIEIYDVKWKKEEDSKWVWFWEKDLAFLISNIDKYIFKRQTYNWWNKILEKQILELRSELDKWKNIIVYLFREIDWTPDESYFKELVNKENELEKEWIKIKFHCINLFKALEILKFNLLNIENKSYAFNNQESKQIELKYQVWISNTTDNTFIWIINLYDYLLFINKAYNVLWKTWLYKFNVREDQENIDIISNIENTIKYDAENFLHFHNGITLTSELVNSKKNNWLYLINPQIINWCQSTEALYNNFYKYIEIDLNIKKWSVDASLTKEDIIENFHLIENLKKANIQFKVLPIKINSKKSYLIEKISEYTNTQVEVKKYQLRSNDLIHYILKDYLKQRWYRYYAKSKDISANNEILIDELFQLIYAYLYDSPWSAKNEKKDIFTINKKTESYLSILEKISLEDIYLIVKFNSIYLEKWEENLKSNKNTRKSYIRFFMVLSYMFLSKNWVDKWEKDFDELLNIIKWLKNEQRYKSTDERTVYTTWWDKFWLELKILLREKYSIDEIKENIEFGDYNLEKLNNYIHSYSKEDKIRKQHSLIDDIFENNDISIKIDDLYEILNKFYSILGYQNKYQNKKITIDNTIKEKFILFKWNVYKKNKNDIIEIGTFIEHHKFWIWMVLSLDWELWEIDFEELWVKHLNIKIAPLKIIK